MTLKLFVPGPVSIREDILEKMSSPMISHRSKDASLIQKNISASMQKLWNTSSSILLSTSSGSGLMEGAIRSCTSKRAAVFSIGAFGDRWYEMAVNNNVPADLFKSNAFTVTSAKEIDTVLATGKYDLVTITHNETSIGLANPLEEISEVIKKYPEVIYCLDTVSSTGGVKIDVDGLGIDICITSSQKCLGLPPGMAVCSFSQKAVERARTVKNRGYYLDLLRLYDYIQKKDFQYPSTPSISHMYAMEYQLDYILNTEGFENRVKRHSQMADIVRNWAVKYFDLMCDVRYASETVTTVKNTRNINVKELNNKLLEYDMQISNGYGDLKDKTFRIAHMADTSIDDINNLLTTINKILKLN